MLSSKVRVFESIFFGLASIGSVVFASLLLSSYGTLKDNSFWSPDSLTLVIIVIYVFAGIAFIHCLMTMWRAKKSIQEEKE